MYSKLKKTGDQSDSAIDVRIIPDGIGVFEMISGSSICNIVVMSLVSGVMIRSLMKSAWMTAPFLKITLPYVHEEQ
jgi:hypothetical protein